ncbi:type IV secretion protein [Bradyrhizobium sp. CCGUVB23]|uniref:type IV secretion protein n=1 Tax=Bradyrhizobium sp. CCGUVB23 TaxID=2949630 RepID=UPI0020B30487|nr:type IV secretion protein [Bradyrhizobium sp. CCGUVB23]MCP3468131.1 type IV secretion protein [Bradyrhizobium sp. CCGUVB23]
MTTIVERASAFEPLLITIVHPRPVPIQASDRNEAIELATEAMSSGQATRTGLAQLDARDMQKAGLTVATTFDACKHIAGLSRLFEARLRAAETSKSNHDQAVASVIASFTAAATATSQPSMKAATSTSISASPDADTGTRDIPAQPSTAPQWDVYRAGLGASTLVYTR